MVDEVLKDARASAMPRDRRFRSMKPGPIQLWVGLVDGPGRREAARRRHEAMMATPKQFGLDPIRDIQVLCPRNRGGVGARLAASS